MLVPESGERLRLLQKTISEIDSFYENIRKLNIWPQATANSIREHLKSYDFSKPLSPDAAIDDSLRMMTEWGLNCAHPRYLGLFNPTSSFMSVIADALVAAVNPQIGGHNHHPGAVEIERHLIGFIGSLFGFDADRIAGSFTCGGSEANYSGVLLALTSAFPEIANGGVRALPGQPVLYVSEEAHDSFYKIAHQCGLGREAVRKVKADESFTMNVDDLNRQIIQDRKDGYLPFLVVATAGTTASGMVDPLTDISTICKNEGLHLHVDAAWGGAAVFSKKLKPFIAGIEHADSITFDAHKWLSVPMGAGMFICTNSENLLKAFEIKTSYIPDSEERYLDYYTTSFQWSRRFTGLKLFLTLAVAGKSGYERVIDHQAEIGEELRSMLRENGWEIINNSPLPLICFIDPEINNKGDTKEAISLYFRLVEQLKEQGECWLSVAMPGGTPCIRACITSFLTDSEDLKVIVKELDRARKVLK